MGRSVVQLAQCLPSMPKAPSQSQHHTNHIVVLHSGGGHGRIRSTRTFSVTQQGGDRLGYMRAPEGREDVKELSSNPLQRTLIQPCSKTG